MEPAKQSITIRGRSVRLDENGLVCLNDIHKAGGFSTNQTPAQWRRLPSTTKLIAYTLERVMGKSHDGAKIKAKSVIYSTSGDNAATWAHPNVALAYAKYLSPALHYEVNDVFLRYKAGDATLADETLQRASSEDNEWAAVRALSRAKRKQYTATLQEHGVEGYGYAQCTDETYKKLFDATAKNLKKTRSIPEAANLRDNMPTDDLVYVMAAEVLASGRIREEKSEGNRECRLATSRSANFIRQAIEADKADRKPRMV